MKKTLKTIFLSTMVLAFFACSKAEIDAPHFTKSVTVHFKSDELAEKGEDTIVSVLINAHKNDKRNTSLSEPLYFIPSEEKWDDTRAVFDTKSNSIVLKIEVTNELENILAWKMLSGQLSNYERLKQTEDSLLVSFPMEHNDMVSFLSAGGTISLYNVPVLTYKNTRTLSTIDIYDYKEFDYIESISDFENFIVAFNEKVLVHFYDDEEMDFEQDGFILNGNKIKFESQTYYLKSSDLREQKDCWIFDTNKKKITLYSAHPTKNIMEKIQIHLSEEDFNRFCLFGGDIYILPDVVVPAFDNDNKYKCRRFRLY